MNTLAGLVRLMNECFDAAVMATNKAFDDLMMWWFVSNSDFHSKGGSYVV
jgi:hypothetical protein